MPNSDSMLLASPDSVRLDPEPAEGAGGGGEGAVTLDHLADTSHLPNPPNYFQSRKEK